MFFFLSYKHAIGQAIRVSLEVMVHQRRFQQSTTPTHTTRIKHPTTKETPSLWMRNERLYIRDNSVDI